MLNFRHWGTGQRRALLIHGLSSDATSWNRLAPELVGQGYRVDAVDLLGHGESPRAARYPLAAMIESFYQAVKEEEYELAIGSSFGALILVANINRLSISRAVYLDPAWQAQPLDRAEAFKMERDVSISDIAEANPRWSKTAVDEKAVMFQKWDPETVFATTEVQGYPAVPATKPSLVVRADPSLAISDVRAEQLAAAGYEVTQILGAGHVIHQDDLPALLKRIDGWL